MECSNKISLSALAVKKNNMKIYSIKTDLPLKCFGQQTNSTPENSEIPHGKSIAKLRICIPRS